MSNGYYRYDAKVFRYYGLPESGLITVLFFLESTRSIFYSPYSVNVTVTNELLEVYKTLISAKTLCFMTFILILSLLPIQDGGYVVYLLNVDTSLYRHESTLPGHQIQKGGYVVYLLNVDTSLYRHESTF